jgi:hypothetical protein
LFGSGLPIENEPNSPPVVAKLLLFSFAAPNVKPELVFGEAAKLKAFANGLLASFVGSAFSAFLGDCSRESFDISGISAKLAIFVGVVGVGFSGVFCAD